VTRPGTVVTVLDEPPPRTAPTASDMAFIVGLTQQGPLGPDLVTSLTDFRNRYGDRVNYGLLWDTVEAYFREGGSRCTLSRVVGPDAVASSLTLQDATPAATLAVTAMSPGDWGNALTVQVATVTGGFQLTVRSGATIVEQSPPLADKAAALDWGAQSRYVTVTVAGAGGTPAVLAATAMTGGDDDHAGVTDAEWQAALARFGRSLGPGQVMAPGNTSATMAGALLDHAAANNRRAVLDAPDTGIRASLSSAATAARTAAPDSARYGALWAPWVRIAGVAGGTTRLIPPSTVIAGLIARSDSAGQPIGRPAANQNGRTRSVVALEDTFTDADLESLYDDRVNLLIDAFDGIKAFGDASLTDENADPAWAGFAANRVVMAVSAQGEAILANHVLEIIDGQGHLFTKIAGELVSMLLPLWQEGSLYGATFDEAARVDTGPNVNTPATIAAREVHAVVAIRTSPAAEMLELELVRVATTEALA
jgi:hypothetical protein